MLVIRAPFLYILYRVTPTLSVETDQERLICDEETAVAERPVGIEGAVVSEVEGEVTVNFCVRLVEPPYVPNTKLCVPWGKYIAVGTVN